MANLDKEAILIATREPGRRQPGAQPQPSRTQPQEGATPGRKKKKRSAWGVFWRFCVVCLCLMVMVGSVGAVLVSLYVVDATASDGDLLNLDNLELAKTSIIYAQNHDTGEWEEYAQLSRTNHRIWVNLDQIPDDMKWAVICLEDKDFYTEPGVNFKRTASVTLNLVLTKLTGGKLSLYSSLQGASTLEQQLIKNITGDNGTDGSDGVTRKLREIFRALGVDNRYSKDTILEAYLNTISLTGTIAGVEAGANEYFI